MKIWVDDVRPAPEGYEWCKSVDDAIYLIDGIYMYHWATEFWNTVKDKLEVIDLDHDAGEYAKFGGDYIKLLDYLEQKSNENNGYDLKGVKFHIHSMNPVGVENMRRIIQKNGWTEV